MTSLIHIFGSLSLSILGLLMIWNRHGLEIDLSQKTYKQYVWIFGYKSGKEVRFKRIDKIFINQVSEGQTATSWGGQIIDYSKEVHKAFLKFDNGEKVHFMTHPNRDVLNQRIKSYLDPLDESIANTTLE